MKVVGQGARQLRGPDGKDLYYDTSSVTIGGGESVEVMIDTADASVAAGNVLPLHHEPEPPEQFRTRTTAG